MGAGQGESRVHCQFTERQTGSGRNPGDTHHLNPVSIRIQDKSDILYIPVGEAFFEWHAESLESCTSGLDIIYGDRDVAESARLGIARMVGRIVERLRAGIVGKLEDA